MEAEFLMNNVILWLFQVRLANRVCTRDRPKESTDLAFELDDRHIPTGFLRERDDMRVADKRHLVFATDQQITGKT